MIGNSIKFTYFDKENKSRESEVKEGLVVDAYTNIKGSISGSSESILSFGSGSTHGKTNSDRVYKVQYFNLPNSTPNYTDIHAWQLIEIIRFADIYMTTIR